jgi:hypothetical protein
MSMMPILRHKRLPLLGASELAISGVLFLLALAASTPALAEYSPVVRFPERPEIAFESAPRIALVDNGSLRSSPHFPSVAGGRRLGTNLRLSVLQVIASGRLWDGFRRVCGGAGRGGGV